MTLGEYLDRVEEQVAKYGPELMALALLRGMLGSGEFRIGFETPDGGCFITVEELKANFPGKPYDDVLVRYRERLSKAVEAGKKRFSR